MPGFYSCFIIAGAPYFFIFKNRFVCHYSRILWTFFTFYFALYWVCISSEGASETQMKYLRSKQIWAGIWQERSQDITRKTMITQVMFDLSTDPWKPGWPGCLLPSKRLFYFNPNVLEPMKISIQIAKFLRASFSINFWRDKDFGAKGFIVYCSRNFEQL